MIKFKSQFINNTRSFSSERAVKMILVIIKILLLCNINGT